MKKFLSVLFFLAINAVLYAAPIRAEDDGADDFGLQEQKGYKDECLLIAVNCSKDFVSIEKKVEKLQKEILKGRAVYTDDELRILMEQLDDAKRTMEYFKYEGADNRHY